MIVILHPAVVVDAGVQDFQEQGLTAHIAGRQTCMVHKRTVSPKNIPDSEQNSTCLYT